MLPSTQKKLTLWLVVSILGLTIFFLLFYLSPNSDHSFTGASDAFFFVGAFEALVPVLILIGRTGLFDVFGYANRRFIESFRSSMEKRWDTVYDYKEYKKGERERHRPYLLPFFVCGGVFLLTSGILAIFALANR